MTNCELTTKEDFLSLLEGSPDEETIHKFLDQNRSIFNINPEAPTAGSLIVGVLSKIPISPDRIPDFTIVNVPMQESQCEGKITFVELKKPDTPLFVTHGRMSRDLNDAWMECIASQRILSLSYRDFFRRIINKVQPGRDKVVEKLYQGMRECKYLTRGRFVEDLPGIVSVVVIGRRSSLSSDEIMRVRELSASTNWTIRVVTYDVLIDDMLNRGPVPWWTF